MENRKKIRDSEINEDIPEEVTEKINLAELQYTIFEALNSVIS